MILTYLHDSIRTRWCHSCSSQCRASPRMYPRLGQYLLSTSTASLSSSSPAALPLLLGICSTASLQPYKYSYCVNLLLIQHKPHSKFNFYTQPLWHVFIDVRMQLWPNHCLPLGVLRSLHKLANSIPPVLPWQRVFMVAYLICLVWMSSQQHTQQLFNALATETFLFLHTLIYKLTEGLFKKPSLLHFV